MNYLNKFLYFSWDDFIADKTLKFVAKKEWRDFKTKEYLGYKYIVAITKDDTDYALGDDIIDSNIYQRFTIKCERNIDIPLNAEIETKGDVYASIYGDYKNQLSVIAEDIVVVSHK